MLLPKKLGRLYQYFLYSDRNVMSVLLGMLVMYNMYKLYQSYL